jgi:SAM-dependent methyltransferase
MKPDDVRRLYDEAYVAKYDAKFLESEMTDADTRQELDIVRSLLAAGGSWLDVGCGTGYFLSRFPDVERAGIDLSPDMLELSRARNPGAEFREHDFREPISDWADRFGLVTCMWYAYGYVDTIDEVGLVIDNLARWTAPDGRCFVPLADPVRLARSFIPEKVDTGWGPLTVDGILWSWIDENGTKEHRHLIAPQMSWMRERFARWFETVETFEYESGMYGQRPGLVASGRRA